MMGEPHWQLTRGAAIATKAVRAVQVAARALAATNMAADLAATGEQRHVHWQLATGEGATMLAATLGGEAAAVYVTARVTTKGQQCWHGSPN